MRQISKIEHGVLQMASGDLKTALPQYPGDEIGILSSKLNQLRITLADTLQQEQESRQANQDLITALSHEDSSHDSKWLFRGITFKKIS